MDKITCPKCEGSGTVYLGEDDEDNIFQMNCPKCKGEGEIEKPRKKSKKSV